MFKKLPGGQRWHAPPLEAVDRAGQCLTNTAVNLDPQRHNQENERRGLKPEE